MVRFRLCGFLAVTLLAGMAGPGFASAQDDFEEFQAAQAAYQGQQYDRAVSGLEALVGGSTPRVPEGPLRLESRKYLAASYLFLGRQPEAEVQFAALLHEDPQHRLDPLAFSNEVISVFSDVQERVEAELAAQNQEMSEAERRRLEEAAAAQARDRERLRALRELARNETVEVQNSRWIAMIPFGPGQFQNGDDALGVTFMLGGLVLGVTSVVAAVLHATLSNTDPDTVDDVELQTQGRNLQLFNWITFSATVALGLVSVIEAQVSYVPVVRSTREREIPQELLEDEEELELTVSPLGFALNF